MLVKALKSISQFAEDRLYIANNFAMWHVKTEEHLQPHRREEAKLIFASSSGKERRGRIYKVKLAQKRNAISSTTLLN